MRTYLFLSPSRFAVAELAAYVDALDEETIWGVWVPGGGSGSIETIDGTITLDYLGDPAENRIETLTPDQITTVASRLGDRPKVMLVLGVSSRHSGSDQLASRVVRDLQARWGGVLYDGERVTRDLGELLSV